VGEISTINCPASFAGQNGDNRLDCRETVELRPEHFAQAANHRAVLVMAHCATGVIPAHEVLLYCLCDGSFELRAEAPTRNFLTTESVAA
jgi:hypothetical protein